MITKPVNLRIIVSNHNDKEVEISMGVFGFLPG